MTVIRSALVRRLALPAALVAALAPAAPAAAFDAPAPTIELAAAAGLGADAFAAPDGAIWDVSRGTRGGPISVTRYGLSGPISRFDAAVPDAGGELRLLGRPQPLTDGTVGLLVQHGRGYPDPHVSDVELLHVGSDGIVASRRSLPQTARRAAGFAIEPDGSVWWARACEDELRRLAPDGRATLLRLPRLGCGAQRYSRNEPATAVALGPDGSVWMANFCRPRIVRVGADGRMRQWRPAGTRCTESSSSGDTYVRQARIVPEQDGGLWFASMLGSGRVRADGRIAAGSPPLGWLDGRDRSWPAATSQLPDRSIVATEPAWGGGRWVTGSRSTYVEAYKQSYSWYADPAVRLYDAAGGTRDWELPPLLDPNHFGSTLISGATLDSAGALWVSYVDTRNGDRTYRVIPPVLPAPREPAAAPTRIAGRSGGTVSVRLRCDAEPGRWCSGTVALNGVAKAGRFVVAGQQEASVRLPLGSRAVARLRRGRALKSRAVAVSGTASETLTRTRELIVRP